MLCGTILLAKLSEPMTTEENNKAEQAADVAVAVAVDVAINCDDWQKLDFDPAALALEIVPMVYAMADIPEFILGADVEFSVVLSDDESIRVLNRDYRGKDKPTNVLSFAALDAGADGVLPSSPPDQQAWLVGDVILSYETIESEAVEQNKTLKDHFTHMLVHGTLHLLGYDHEEDSDATIMENLEIGILEKRMIESPYS